jgi:hypothetical protein
VLLHNPLPVGKLVKIAVIRRTILFTFATLKNIFSEFCGESHGYSNFSKISSDFKVRRKQRVLKSWEEPVMNTHKPLNNVCRVTTYWVWAFTVADDVNSALGCLCRVNFSSVAYFRKSTIKIEMYFRNICNIAHIHTVQTPKIWINTVHAPSITAQFDAWLNVWDHQNDGGPGLRMIRAEADQPRHWHPGGRSNHQFRGVSRCSAEVKESNAGILSRQENERYPLAWKRKKSL